MSNKFATFAFVFGFLLYGVGLTCDLLELFTQQFVYDAKISGCFWVLVGVYVRISQ